MVELGKRKDAALSNFAVLFGKTSLGQRSPQVARIRRQTPYMMGPPRYVCCNAYVVSGLPVRQHVGINAGRYVNGAS